MPLIRELDRAEFLGCYFDYNPGEHITFWEPTGQGKTEILWQMAEVAMRQNPELRLGAAMPKSIDPATRKAIARYGLKITETWPPPPAFPGFGSKPMGHVHWPKHLRGVPVKQNREYLAGHFRKLLSRQLADGNSLTIADDAYQIAVLLGLNLELEELLTLGQGPKAGLWLAGQKASGTRQGSITSFCLNSWTHLVMGHDPYYANRRRLADISGVDLDVIAAIVPKLRVHRMWTDQGWKNISEKLYIRKDGPYMAIIGL